MRVARTVPASNVVDHDCGGCRSVDHGRGLCADAVDCELDLVPIGHGCLECNDGARPLERGGHDEARPTMVIEREVAPVRRDEGDVAIHPAVEREVRALRVGRGVRCVVDHHGNHVVFDQRRRQLVAERRVATVVSAEVCPVQVDVSGRVGTSEFHPHLVVAGIQRELLEVGRGTSSVVVAAILTVEGVPRVRQGHALTPCRGQIPFDVDGVRHEHPAVVERFHAPASARVVRHLPLLLRCHCSSSTASRIVCIVLISASRVCPPAATNRSIRAPCVPIDRSRATSLLSTTSA